MMSASKLLRSAILGSAFALCAFVPSGQAKSYTVLHDFAGAPTDGSYPFNDVSFDAAGNIYGTTNLGGSKDSGTVFKITPDGTESVLHSFDGGAGGSDPNAGVTIDPVSGTMYGTASFGGSAGACRGGCGVLYSLATDGTYTLLHSFDNAVDGENPGGQLVRDSQGNLFGVTVSSGPKGGGTLFEYSAQGTYTVLHAFANKDGVTPLGGLLLGKNGNLYGVTNSGGAYDYGVIYEFSKSGAFKRLYSFTGGADGGYPAGGLARDNAGNLYGATNLSGNGGTPYGTVFRLAPDGTLTTLYTFNDGADGGYPAGDIRLVNGKLYGTTTAGGDGDNGVLYAVDTASQTETVVHNFSNKGGVNPQAGVTNHHGFLFGVTSAAGADGFGTLFGAKIKKDK